MVMATNMVIQARPMENCEGEQLNDWGRFQLEFQDVDENNMDASEPRRQLRYWRRKADVVGADKAFFLESWPKKWREEYLQVERAAHEERERSKSRSRGVMRKLMGRKKKDDASSSLSIGRPSYETDSEDERGEIRIVRSRVARLNGNNSIEKQKARQFIEQGFGEANPDWENQFQDSYDTVLIHGHCLQGLQELGQFEMRDAKQMMKAVGNAAFANNFLLRDPEIIRKTAECLVMKYNAHLIADFDRF